MFLANFSEIPEINESSLYEAEFKSTPTLFTRSIVIFSSFSANSF